MPASTNVKAKLVTETGDDIPFLFNPASLSFSHNTTWNSSPRPGGGAPRIRYGGTASATLSFEMFLDTTATGRSVTEHTGRLLDLTHANQKVKGADSKSRNMRPPWVKFAWGSFESFKAGVASLQLTFEYFAADGTPLRARAQISLTQWQDEHDKVRQNPTSGTPNPHSLHRVQPGETLDRIAAEHYGDPTAWRAIAAANAVEDPLTLRPGRLIGIPRISG